MENDSNLEREGQNRTERNRGWEGGREGGRAAGRYSERENKE